MDENSYSKRMNEEEAKRLLEEGRELFPPEPRVILPTEPEPPVPLFQQMVNAKRSILWWTVILLISAGGLWMLSWRLFVAFGLFAAAACPC